jgi:ketosteroid isomerase-like protein
MHQKIAPIIVMALLLAACGQIKVDVPDTVDAQAAQVLVEAYITTNVEYDAEGLLALYADDIFWMDYGGTVGPLGKGDLNYLVPVRMAAEEFKIEFSSYLVTSDGKYAVVEGIFSEFSALTGKWVEAPFVLVLEFKNGLIASEEWYSNMSPLH